ncbi:MAG: hypothetical protein A3J79_04915 [Elusimicrobia bacterium RIFOXYB2_FULL_62_6]|nr:MAG: hypothetical protein A3J79_04915 [Elusimicrobia bacterium RIFOXYB2_FULL_62_6]
MKIRVIFPLLLAFSLGLCAVWAKDSTAAPAKKAEPAAAEPQKTPAPAPKKEVKPAEPEEEGSVMIDSKAGDAEPGEEPEYRPRSQGEADEVNVPGGLPVSYGFLKGTLTEGGRNLLVFENEDGTITFVQVTVGKSAAAWKLVARIRRSLD